ncbi:MAG TPA: ABC transporter permease [Patescibacteria group bacterium]
MDIIKKTEPRLRRDFSPKQESRLLKFFKAPFVFFNVVIWHTLGFTLTLFLYLAVNLVYFVLAKLLFLKKTGAVVHEKGMAFCKRFSLIFFRSTIESISQVDLINLAVSNLRIKKTRTFVTVGGMMMGIGAIVFLVSIGYGLQNLVISRVAKLEEMRQADVVMQTGRQVKITDKTVEDFKQISGVDAALPLISVVGKVSFNSSVADMAVYGVPADYLKNSAIHPTSGALFDSNETSLTDVQPASSGERQAVVNKPMLSILGIQEDEAIGKTFSVSFIAPKELLDDDQAKIESSPMEYKIVGVVQEGAIPLFYVPFLDLRSLGIYNYSQIKVVANSQPSLDLVRKKIEAMGYVTHSVVDTVNQINNLFTNMRLGLALIGMIALGVAALGMFNTLTVSLLERTREVGLLKSMGMSSSEVRKLFLTESMTMGFFGGIMGILAGYLAGKGAGLMLSMIALTKGVGMVDVSSVPWKLSVSVVLLSVIVGFLTGLYPARRATRISALDALRYE